MKKILGLSFALMMSFFITACGGGGTDVVESGTYQGTIAEVEADKDEIYVQVDDKKLELYFTEETELMRGEETVEFSELKEGQKVEVKVKKVGKRLDPLKVVILE